MRISDQIKKLKSVTKFLTLDLGRKPLPEEIASEMGITLEKALKLQKIIIHENKTKRVG